MDKVITIGRQFGSGGHEVGYRLAKKLNIPFYDKELLTLTAENSRFAEEYLKKMDEHKPGFLSGGSSGFASGAVIGGGEGMMSHYYNLSANDQIFLEQGKVIKELASKGPCVIVGRGSDYVLKDFGSINIFVFAPIKDRVVRKMALDEEKKATADEVRKYIEKTDKTRAKYYEYYTHDRWGDAAHYSLCVNTAEVGIDGAVDVICKYVESYGKKSLLPDV